ncbi:MAG: transporter, binding protein [Gammaproteobacteria bacterium]|jgi:phospholipid/cholesterol/gamma-HCH transport system ATP-binding protein|nr:transporter, binding protein [Gammaproteobacteria bacterium]
MRKSTAPIISIADVKNVLGKQVVHEHLNLDIMKGEITAIVGGSGCGKTTLLRNILMLLRPKSGSIKIFDIDILHCDIKTSQKIRHSWGVLFQHGALFSALTVLENVQFPLRTFTTLPPKVQKEIALLKITMSGLPLEAAFKYPSELSGGMLKRAALARAIVMDPELLFLDEPTSGLDPQSAGAFDELLLDLKEGLGLTVVMVTHDLSSLAHVSDKVVFLGEKKVLAALPLQELLKQKHPLIQAYFSGSRGESYVKSA